MGHFLHQSMTNHYTTQPGTIPHRVIEYLRRMTPGASIATAPLADEIGVDKSSIDSFMAPAVHHGIVKQDRRDGLIHWSIGSGISAPAAIDHDDDPETKQNVALTSANNMKNIDDSTVKLLEEFIKPEPISSGITQTKAPIHLDTDTDQQKPVFGKFSDGSALIEQSDKFLRLGKRQARTLQSFMRKAWNQKITM